MRTSTLASLLAVLAVLASVGAVAQEARQGPYSLQLVDEAGRALPTFHRAGRTYVMGAVGERYLLRIRNDSPRRVEVVASVDGRDVVDGKPSSLQKRGYLVPAYGEITIDGFRLSEQEVAAFRFSSVSRSYAARMGNAREVGVIGAAVFPEAQPIVYYRPPPPPPPPPPYWYDRDLRPGYDPPAAERSAPSASADAAPQGQSVAPAPATGTPSPPTAMAPQHKAVAKKLSEERAGLGTEFGEQHESEVEMVSFQRASSSPAAVLSLRYNDRQGLSAMGIDVDAYATYEGELRLRESAQPFRQDGVFAQPPPAWEPR